MTNILNELWDGEIHPQDSLIDGNEYYKDLQHLLSRNQADLAGTLSDEQKDLFEKYCDILGDVGANYYLNKVDSECKHLLNSLKCTVFCIHGNHECRPEHIPSYRLIEWNGGKVWIEDAFPNLLFAKDGEIFHIEGQNYLVIGGAYSIDASWRIRRHAGWWADEQPSVSVKAFVEHQIAENKIDIVLSHTCPRKYEPVEIFLPNVNQAGVDKNTEDWLDTVENSLSYKAWYCGHWHTDKRIDRMHFLFTSWETVEKEIYDGTN